MHRVAIERCERWNRGVRVATRAAALEETASLSRPTLDLAEAETGIGIGETRMDRSEIGIPPVGCHRPARERRLPRGAGGTRFIPFGEK